MKIFKGFGRWGLYVIIIAMFSVMLYGCGKSSKNFVQNKDIAKTESKQEFNGVGSKKDKTGDNKENSKANEIGEKRKIIKKAEVSIETKDLDSFNDKIVNKVKDMGGYIESSSISKNTGRDSYSRRYADLNIRIPEKSFEDFMSGLNEMGNITRKAMNGQDITSEYFDIEANLKTLKIQEERLIEILKKTEDVKNLIEIERELQSVRYKIEGLTGSIKKYDNLISYATINLNAYEVAQVTLSKKEPKNLMDKVTNVFIDSLKAIKTIGEGIVIVVVAIIPFLLVIGVVLLILKFVFKIDLLKKLNPRNKKQ